MKTVACSIIYMLMGCFVLIPVNTKDVLHIRCIEFSEFDPNGLYYLGVSFCNKTCINGNKEKIGLFEEYFLLTPRNFSCPLVPDAYQHILSTCQSVPAAAPQISSYNYSDTCPIIYRIEATVAFLILVMIVITKILKYIKAHRQAKLSNHK